jgi:hypothetical protein
LHFRAMYLTPAKRPSVVLLPRTTWRAPAISSGLPGAVSSWDAVLPLGRTYGRIRTRNSGVPGGTRAQRHDVAGCSLEAHADDMRVAHADAREHIGAM